VGGQVAGRLEGRVAVVTGAASGIGEATARRFVDEGARVVVADVQTERGSAVAASLGDAARFVDCDVTSEDAVAGAIALAVDTWGRLDVMFNNAGVVGAIGPIAETDTTSWLKTIDILVHSVFYGCKHAAKVMVPQGSGSIISTSSAAGVLGGLGPHAYTTAKTAVIGLTKSVASELGASGVRCNAIAPGTIPTPLTAVVTTGDPDDLDAVAESTRARYGRAGEALDIANAALYLASDESAFVNGHTLVVDYGRTINGGSGRFATSTPAMVGIAGVDR
jgi:NAD(P)-dependent dehydrogenase (short-subunit alcohol dehydrogenase family)